MARDEVSPVKRFETGAGDEATYQSLSVNGLYPGRDLFCLIRGVIDWRVSHVQRTQNARNLMPTRIRRVNYFYAMVPDQPGEAYRLLSELAKMKVNLVAFTAIPFGPSQTQMALFPEEDAQLKHTAESAGLALDGPHPAFLVQGDNELAELAKIHEQLFKANVNVYAATGVTAGQGNFGYLVYVRPEQYESAAEALGV